MAKGSYTGGGTVIGPKDAEWFGTGGVKNGPRPDADVIKRRQKAPLTAAAEQRISNLRVDVAGLRQQLAAVERERDAIAARLDASARDLAKLLHHHGLPPDDGLPPPSPEPGQGKTTRHERRERARENIRNGRK